MITLVLGGARSGKSSFAERLAAKYGPRVLYIATATVDDDEMRCRVAEHRARRPVEWETVEESLFVSTAMEKKGAGRDAVILDCLGFLVSNLLMDSEGAAETEGIEGAAIREVEALIRCARSAGTPLIVVSNEVGMGVVPEYPLGRSFRDALGRANQVLAEAAHEVYLLVAGIPMRIKGGVE